MREIQVIYDVINHKGSLSSGHYYSYAKFSKESYNKWYEFNGDRVVELGTNLNDNPYAYILFYKKID